MKIWETFDYPGIDDPKKVTDEIILENVRRARNVKLAACDWTQVADSPVDKAAWAAYRQQLRDLPTSGKPKTLEWPSEPTNGQA